MNTNIDSQKFAFGVAKAAMQNVLDTWRGNSATDNRCTRGIHTMGRPSYPNTIIRVAPEIYDELQDLCKQTHRPIGAIASEALEFALNNCTLVEVKAYDVRFGKEERRKDK